MFPFSLILAACAAAQAGPVVDGLVEGQVQIPAVVGRPSGGAIDLRGASLFVCPTGEAVGRSRWCADGRFSFTAPPGDYCVLLEPAESYRRGQLLTGLRIGVGELRWNAELSPDYNCTFSTMTDWHNEPWAWGTVFEQTFIARGTSITSVALKLAGLKNELGEVVLSISIRKGLNGKPVGPDRQLKAKPIDDLSVSWAPGEVPTVPGETYALRVADVDEKKPIGLFVRREHGFGYPYGELFIDGKANRSDGYFYIGSNGDGTVQTYCTTGGEPAGPPAARWSQTFTARGTSLGAVSVPLSAEGRLSQLTISIHKGGPGGQRVGAGKNVAPAHATGKRWLAGVACQRDEIPLAAGEKHALVISCAAGEKAAALAAEPAGKEKSENALAMRIYEYQTKELVYKLPPPSPPAGYEFDETIPLVNSGFETGKQTGWESAWGGSAFTDVVGAEWKADKFSGDAAAPFEGKFCGVIAAEKTEVRKLIRRWFSWDFPGSHGLCHARVWVASSDGADKSTNPLTVRLCVSASGSPDAGHVAWSDPVVSPGKWTMLQCQPVVPKAKKLSLFLLVQGGSEHEEHYVKIDKLQLIVDEK